jgi:hypothetical protein
VDRAERLVDAPQLQRGNGGHVESPTLVRLGLAPAGTNPAARNGVTGP